MIPSDYECDGQMSLDDYISDYKKQCRHRLGDYCAFDRNRQCPCDDYEKSKSCYENGIPCIGQKDRLRCFKPESCKRYCFVPGVRTNEMEDKYEPTRVANKK